MKASQPLRSLVPDHTGDCVCVWRYSAGGLFRLIKRRKLGPFSRWTKYGPDFHGLILPSDPGYVHSSQTALEALATTKAPG